MDSYIIDGVQYVIKLSNDVNNIYFAAFINKRMFACHIQYTDIAECVFIDSIVALYYIINKLLRNPAKLHVEYIDDMITITITEGVKNLYDILSLSLITDDPTTIDNFCIDYIDSIIIDEMVNIQYYENRCDMLYERNIHTIEVPYDVLSKIADFKNINVIIVANTLFADLTFLQGCNAHQIYLENNIYLVDISSVAHIKDIHIC